MQKRSLATPADSREQLLAHCRPLDLAARAADGQPFLFNPCDERLMALLSDYIAQVLG